MIFSYRIKLILKYQVSFSDLGLAILLVFLPSLLLSLISTVNFRDKSSLKILYRHPSLIILPTVTFFTFSRHNTGCVCSGSNRVSFSRIFTWLNIAVNTLGYAVCGALLQSKELSYILSFIHFYPLIPLSSILLTALFLHLDKLCCCCCNPREQLSVYDPELDKRFIMVDGEVLEDPEDDQRIGIEMEQIELTVALNADNQGDREHCN